MKKQLAFLFFLMTILSQISCNINSTNDARRQPNYVGSTVFIQPLNKTIELAFASVKVSVFFEFIDSTYCNVTIKSAAGDGIQSRKYTIDNDVLTLEDPLAEKKIHFKMVTENDSTIYLINDKGEKMYKMLSGSSITNTLNSDNELKKDELLYPTLDAKEREFGAEDQIIMKDGMVRMVRHPMQEQARKINVFNLF